MASSTRSEMLREREEERRLNMRTLVIASFASAAAAAVTSQLWIHGTWIAAALTPVLVALISEVMHRPTERIARAWTSDRSPRRRMALGVVAATAALAFGIAVAALTVGDLISGGSIGKGDGSSTFFNPTAKKKDEPQQDAKPTQTTPEQTPTTEEQPTTDEPAPQEQPTDTAPTTPLPEAPPGEPAPDATP